MADSVLFDLDDGVLTVTLNEPESMNALTPGISKGISEALERAEDDAVRVLLLTGSGRAPKEQIQHAVRTELRLATIPEPNDVADASAIALCLYHSVRFAA